MRLNFLLPSRSITASVTSEELSDFVVLSGPNGSGKSNLLQAIQEGAIVVDDVGAPNATNVRLFQLGGLVANTDGANHPGAFRDRHVQTYEQFNSYRIMYRQPHHRLSEEGQEEEVRRLLINQRVLNAKSIDDLLTASGKPFLELSIDDFRRWAPLLPGVKDPFYMNLTEVFLTYHARRNRNLFDRWLLADGQTIDVHPLTDVEFESAYGPPPWEVLNTTLGIMGLEYEFVPPVGHEESLPYSPDLKHLSSGSIVRVENLSSGEKTLLVISLCLYSSTQMLGSIALPEVLLLDEADASLHPSMVRHLLQVVDEVFRRQFGVKVILTTHSPTTVALAPADSLFVMSRTGSPRVRRASRDDALSSLTVGLPMLSVRMENRRQVFVESEDDQECYQLLFSLLRSQLESAFSLDFIASGKGGAGDSNAVKRLVKELRASGNDSVWGIVDRDERQGGPAGITFNADRYSLENLVLDPLGVGVYLLRSGSVNETELGLKAGTRHFQVTSADAQAISSSIASRIAQDGDDLSAVAVAYAGGFEVSVPTFWMNMNGHVLEKRLTDTFLTLRKDGKGLKARIVSDALADVPAYVPVEIVRLFQALLRS